jgi:hypothetical protein
MDGGQSLGLNRPNSMDVSCMSSRWNGLRSSISIRSLIQSFKAKELNNYRFPGFDSLFLIVKTTRPDLPSAAVQSYHTRRSESPRRPCLRYPVQARRDSF